MRLFPDCAHTGDSCICIHVFRRTEDLHKGRLSEAGARYFVTITTKQRRPCLKNNMASVLGMMESIELAGGVLNLCAVIMPDHLHWLFELGDQLALGRVVSKFKGSLSREKSGNMQFQRDFHDHRLRPDDESEGYGLYMFMNPYRAGVTEVDEIWAGWKCWKPGAFPFLNLCRPGPTPQVEWVRTVVRPF